MFLFNFMYLLCVLHLSRVLYFLENDYSLTFWLVSIVKVDDILETKLDTMFRLVLDKGTLDAIGLHPDGPIKR